MVKPAFRLAPTLSTDNMRRNNKGFTLLELVFTISLIVFLISSILFVYIVSMRSAYHQGNRTDLHEKLHFALERIVRDVRNANAISVGSNALRFTLNESGTDNSYIYYLYNSSDVWPPAYSQSSYELKRTSLSGGIAGTFTYGNGDLIATGINPPSSSTITSSSGVAQLKLSSTLGNDTMAVSGYVRPRNA